MLIHVHVCMYVIVTVHELLHESLGEILIAPPGSLLLAQFCNHVQSSEWPHREYRS